MTPAEFISARKFMSLTQTQLGEALGCKSRTIWAIENGGAVPRLYALAMDGLLHKLAAARE